MTPVPDLPKSGTQPGPVPVPDLPESGTRPRDGGVWAPSPTPIGGVCALTAATAGRPRRETPVRPRVQVASLGLTRPDPTRWHSVFDPP